MWLKREVSYALDQARLENRIIPVLFQDADYADLWALTVLQMIDFRGAFDAGCANLLRVWGLGYRPQS